MMHPKPARGRPPHNPSATDRRLVQVLASEGISQAQISSVLNISAKTLRRHYRPELRRGASKFECALALRLIDLAAGNSAVSLKATIFLLRCRFGWSRYLPAAASRRV